MLSLFTLWSTWFRIPEPAIDLPPQSADGHLAGQAYFIVVDFVGYCMLVLGGCALIYLLGVSVLCLYQSKLATETTFSFGRQSRKVSSAGGAYRAKLNSARTGRQQPAQPEPAP